MLLYLTLRSIKPSKDRSGILEPFDGPLSGQDFRVYKYLGTDITYMFREKSSYSGINPVYAVGIPREGVLTLAQGYQPVRDNPAVVDVMLRTFFADGSDKKVVTRFLIEALTEVSLEVNKARYTPSLTWMSQFSTLNDRAAWTH